MATYRAVEMDPQTEGRYYSPKMQWWCAHLHIDGDDHRRWDAYVWPALGALDEAWIASLHNEDQVIDLTKLHMDVGSIQAARSGVDVRAGLDRIEGTYPNYAIHVEGDQEGQHWILDAEMVAGSPAFEAVPDLRGITWHYIPRLTVTARITHGDQTVSGSGTGYLEKRRGRFWAPGIKMGLWESMPSVPGANLSVPLSYKVWRNDGTPQLQTLTFSDDGETMIDLPEVDIEFLQMDRFDGFEMVEHPTRYRITASGEHGSAQLEVTRSPHRLKMHNYFADPDDRADFVGMYGTGTVRGRLDLRGTTYEVDAPSFGSALFFGENGRFQ